MVGSHSWKGGRQVLAVHSFLGNLTSKINYTSTVIYCCQQGSDGFQVTVRSNIEVGSIFCGSSLIIYIFNYLLFFGCKSVVGVW